VPHHLIDLVDPDEDYSVADYQKDAYRAIAQQLERGKLPFLVGGTGLYIRAVTGGYAFGEKGKNEALRKELARQAREQGLAALYERLLKLDPKAAQRIHPRDQRRIIRALEVHTLEGRPISQQVEQTAALEPAFEPMIFALNVPRPLLYRRIEERVEAMLQAGFLAEVKMLLDRGYAHDCPGLQILGYRQLVQYIQGAAGWEETVAEIKKQTRRLAKRQLTWFKREAEITWLEVTDSAGLDVAAEIIYSQVKEILP
jgi:tRNA dimethylallyltransferase